MGVEEHGAGGQLVRVRLWPRISRLGYGLLLSLVTLTALAARDGATLVALVLGVGVFLAAARTILECSVAQGAAYRGASPCEAEEHVLRDG